MTQEEYQRALNNIAGTFGTLKDQVNRAFDIGRALGFDDMQIGGDVRDRIKGLVSISTIQRMLPETAKHKEFTNKAVKLNAAEFANKPKAIKIIASADLPLPIQPIFEVRPEPEPIQIVDRKIRLDTAKFRSDLRIALINGDKVWLTYNSAHEVIKISE